MDDVQDPGTKDSSDITVTVIIIAVTLLVYLFVVLRRNPSANKNARENHTLLLRRSVLLDSPKERDQYASCMSPDCVRCKRYEIVKAEAQEKFVQFKELSDSSGLDRISASLCDMNSLPAEPLQKPNVLYVPGLRSQPFWNGNDEFLHETNLLERQWGFILKEFESVYEDPGALWMRNNTETGSWSALYFYNQGERINRNCRKCPRTVALVESLSSFMKVNLFGNAFFSVLDSGTEVAEHCGPCNIRIRCHLGLVIPEKSSVTVGGQTKSYNLGCCTYFDDSFLHSSVNPGPAGENLRAVLLLDLWHPDLSMKERDALNFVFPSAHLI